MVEIINLVFWVMMIGLLFYGMFHKGFWISVLNATLIVLMLGGFFQWYRTGNYWYWLMFVPAIIICLAFPKAVGLN